MIWLFLILLLCVCPRGCVFTLAPFALFIAAVVGGFYYLMSAI